MKKISLLLIILCVAFSSLAQVKKGAVKTNPILMGLGFINFSYERPFNEKHSGQLGAGIFSDAISNTSVKGFSIVPAFRRYSKESIKGFYWGPVANFSSFNGQNIAGFNGVSFIINEADFTVLGFGAKLGWNWLLGNTQSFVIDLGVGLQYLSLSKDLKSGVDDFDINSFDGLIPIIDFSLGYAFD